MTDPGKKILIVDDEPQIVRVLKGYLENAGYRVISSADGRNALMLFSKERPDFIILDLNLPGLDGLEICRSIRDTSNVPILMLTARSEEADKIVGLELGADDYIVKPFSPREIVARVRTILRRVGDGGSTPETIHAGNLVIDIDKHTVHLSGRLVDLTPTEFDILVTLAKQPKRVFSRLQLLESALDINYEGYDRTIDTHIKNIRIKLEPNPKNPVYIQTVFGLGYKFEIREDHAHQP
jgi:DNA-binding response OmpR family regulator